MLALQDDRYAPGPASRAFPLAHAEALAALMPGSMEPGDIAWTQCIRAWIQAVLEIGQHDSRSVEG